MSREWIQKDRNVEIHEPDAQPKHDEFWYRNRKYYQLRNIKLAETNCTCQRCKKQSSPENLEVLFVHTPEDIDPFNPLYNTNNLIVLCPDCYKIAQDLINEK
jgi:hypothetical protein